MTKKKLFWLAFGVLLMVFALIQFIPPPQAPDPDPLSPEQSGAPRD